MAKITSQREYYTTNDDNYVGFYGVYWDGQNFIAESDYTITKVRLKLYRVLSPGTITVSIRATGSDQKPTGSDLCSGTLNGSVMTTDSNGAWYEFDFGAGAPLTKGMRYAIVVRATSGDSSNLIRWRGDHTSPGYVVGYAGGSSDSGATWAAVAYDRCRMFDITGTSAIMNEAAGSRIGKGLGPVDSVSTGGPPASLSLGLMSYWRFDGNATDSVGQNHGTVTGALNNASYGKINQGYSFSGSTDKIKVGTDILPLATETAPFSVNAWGYNTSMEVVNILFNFENMCYFWRGKVSSTYYNRFYVYDGADKWVEVTSATKGSGYFMENTWNMYTLVYDGTYLTGYINGDSLGSIAASKIYWTYASRDWIIGNSYSGSGSPWVGYIDEVGIWNKVLNINEIKALYNMGIGFAYPFVNLPTSTATYGYWAGGRTANTSGAGQVTADRIVFSTGITSANTVSNLSVGRYLAASISDSKTYGYFCGGYSSGSMSATDRITFSTGATAANTGSDLSTARYAGVGIGDGNNYGYITGGYTGATTNTTDRLTFSTSAVAAQTTSNLVNVRGWNAGTSDNNIYGYVFGGENLTVLVSETERITFSTGVFAVNTVSNISQARENLSALSDKSTFGYIVGGYTASAAVATTDRIHFSTGTTVANTASNLTSSKFYPSGISDGGIFGYIGGGATATGGGAVATSDRIIFSTGVTSANTISNISQARYGLSGISNYSS